MIADPQLRWVVTAALLAAILLCGVGLVGHRGGRIGAVGHGLHVIMALAMIDMAWPSALFVPLTGGLIVFAAIALWYLVVTVAGHYRPVNGGYHVVMMAAMAWMYAVMSDDVVHRTAGAVRVTVHGDGGMGGMQMSTFEIGLTASHHHGGGGSGMSMADGLPGWAIALDWACVVGFAAAALWWLVRYFRVQSGGSRSLAGDSAGVLCQVLMAGSMSAMFAVMV